MVSIKWDVTYKCNLMCGHCINGNYLTNKDNEIVYEDMVKVINKINDNIPVGYIHFLGGEPLTHPDILPFFKYLETQGIQFGFNTNGLLLNEKNFEYLASLNCLTNIVVSLEGPTAEVNDAIRGRNIFNVIMKRIRMISAYKRENPDCKIKIVVNTVVTSMNYGTIGDIIDLCVREDVDSLQLLEFIEDGNGVGKNYSLTDEMFMEAITTVAKRFTLGCDGLEIVPKFCRPLVKDYIEKCLHLKFPLVIHGCGAGATTLFLDNKGNVYPCDRSRKYCNRQYSLLDEDFFSVWESEDFKLPFSRYYGDELYRTLIPCNGCKYLGDVCFPCHLSREADVDAVMHNCNLLDNMMKEVDGNEL